MLCYAMLCYAMLCYAMLCYAMLSHQTDAQNQYCLIHGCTSKQYCFVHFINAHPRLNSPSWTLKQYCFMQAGTITWPQPSHVHEISRFSWNNIVSWCDQSETMLFQLNAVSLASNLDLWQVCTQTAIKRIPFRHQTMLFDNILSNSVVSCKHARNNVVLIL